MPLLEAAAGTRSSYIWKSLYPAIDLIKEGIQCKVGRGDQIKIWQHKWIPIPSSYMIQSPRSMLLEDAMVEALIDAETRDWNPHLIHQLFSPQEAEIICKIPLSRENAKDKLVGDLQDTGTS